MITIDQLRQGYEPDAIEAELQKQLAPAVPEALSSWLGRLGLLYGVPFEYLVPHIAMLPAESLRFFYIDANWIEALVDGAFSIGTHSQRDIRYHKVLQHQIRDETDIAAGKLRRTLRSAEDSDIAETPHQAEPRVRAGFLFRSAIVAGWPGLEVAGYRKRLPGEASLATDFEHAHRPGEHYWKLALLRLERLTPSLMLAIFADVPDLIVFNEPAEDFHFGVGEASDGSLSITLRDLSTAQHLSASAARIDIRQNRQRTLDIVTLKNGIDGQLPAVTSMPGKEEPDHRTVGSAILALQLIDAPDRWHFDAEQIELE